MKLQDVITGDVLMLFINNKSIGGATSHTLSVSPEYAEISCKDAGITPWKKLTKVGWEIQSENLYVETEYKSLMTNVMADTEFEVIFGTSNWASTGLGSAANWTPASSGALYKGKVKISSITLNAASGDNATYSVTFTGTSALAEYTPAGESTTQAPGE